MNFWDVFDAAATRFADRTAIEVQARSALVSLTYRELRELALARARWLHAQGVSRGERCAILADNDGWWCAAYLGILRLGAIAVPLDTNYSAAQVRTILADSGARVVFVNARLAAVAEEAATALPGILIADIASPTVDNSGSDQVTLPDPPDEHATAVILYTSGTTADPKGVMLSHANLLAEHDAAFKVVSVSEKDSVLGVLPLFHALAQLANLLLPLAIGARVVFLETLSSSELLRALAERRITVFACVPQFFYLIHERLFEEVARRGFLARFIFRRLLAASFLLRRWFGLNVGRLLFRRVHAKLGPDMRLLLTGGSKFDPAIGRDFYALGMTILQAYGLTETCGAATLTDPHDAYLDTVGRALPGQEIRILPPTQADLDGEIAIRGPIVMQGYFNRDDATRAVMRDGWFMTGDLGRLDARGRLTITGRSKEVIVLANGKNIYPEEVEAQYSRSPFIKEICVLGIRREGEPAAERLYAVVVPDTELLRQRRIANAGDLIRFEMEGQVVHLPPHQHVLGYEIWFEPLPRTTTGKLKRHEIERRLRGAAMPAGEAVPDSETETAWIGDADTEAILEVIRERAHSRSIRPDANLELDLGLDSMERVELLTELEQGFGARVDPDRAHEIFTVKELVDAVRAGGTGNSRTRVEESWDVLLSTDEGDAAWHSLLERRPVTLPVLFAASRVIRLFLGPDAVSGIERLPRDGPYIIAPNHQGYLDPFILCAVLPYRVLRRLFFVGAAEYFETPLTRWLAKKINLLPVDPDANLVPAMKAAAFGLRHGKILVLFPEGERSIDGTVKRFKKGAPILAQHLHVPVVPVAIRGAFELWPRNRPLNWRMLWPGGGRRVRLAIGSPIRFARDGRYVESASRLQEIVKGMWEAI